MTTDAPPDRASGGAQHEGIEHALRERVKELTCLQAVNRALHAAESLAEAGPRVAGHLAAGMQYPGLAVAVVAIEGEHYASGALPAGASPTLQAAVRRHGETVGLVSVAYREPREFLLPEEQALVDAVADALGVWYARLRASAELRDSEEMLRTVMRSISDVVAEIDADGVVRFASPSVTQITGHPLSAVVGHDAFRYVHPDDADGARAILARAFAEPGRIVHATFRYLHADGSKLVFDAVGKAIHDPRTDAPVVVLTAREVSAQRRQQRELEQARQRAAVLEAIVERSPVMAFHWSLEPGWPVTFVSDNVRQLGYVPADFLEGRIAYGDIVHPEDRPRIRAEIEEFVAGRGTHLLQRYRLVARGGGVRWVEDRTTVQRAADGRGLSMQGLVVDVTEREQAERALARRTRALATLSAGNTAIIHARDPAELLQNVCNAIVEHGGYRLAWVGVAEDDANKTVRRLAAAGPAADYVRAIRVSWSDAVPEGLGPLGTCIRTGRTVVMHDAQADPRFAPWREAAARHDLRAAIALPVALHEGRAGALVIYAPQPEVFDEEACRLLEQMAADITFGLHALEIAADRARKAAELAASEARMRKVIDDNAFGIVVTDARGRILLVNPAGERLLGRSARELAGTELGRLDRGRDPQEVTVRTGDGATATVEVHPVDIDWEGAPATLLTLHDVTARQQAEQALRESEERFRLLYDDNPTTYVTCDPHGTILSVNRFGAEQLGYAPGELVGRSFAGTFHREDREPAVTLLEDAFSHPGSVHQLELRQHRRDGSTRWVRATARVVTAGRHTQAFVVCEDVTVAHELSAELSWQARHDQLTGLPNRREFEQRLHAALAAAETQGAEHVLCYLDLDQFKIVNDTCGHVAGDALLRQIAEVLARRVRAHDTLARLGGDEFGVLMENCTIGQGEHVAGELLRAIGELLFAWEEQTFRIGASAGLVSVATGGHSVERLLAMADEACYAAKDAGRNRVHVYHESDSELARRHGEMLWIARLHRALDQDLLELAYQRIAPLDPRNRHLRVELLLRMRAEDGTLIAPGAFLPAAERFNLTPRLDSWVIRTAFAWLRARPALLDRLHLCCINLSGLSLGDRELQERLIAEFADGLAAAKICFEITETAAITNFAAALDFIGTLRECGCHFALDDFGSGMSSFAYLRTLPVDYLKIDGAFVRDIATDPIDLAMVRSINEIGHVMGKKTIAEFVENDAVLARLAEIGVDYAQGYGIAPPRPLADLEGEP